MVLTGVNAEQVWKVHLDRDRDYVDRDYVDGTGV